MQYLKLAYWVAVLFLMGCIKAPENSLTPSADATQGSTVGHRSSSIVEQILDRKMQFGFYQPQPVRLIFEEMIGDVFFNGKVEVDPEITETFIGEMELESLRVILDRLCEDTSCVWEATGDPPTLYIHSKKSNSERP